MRRAPLSFRKCHARKMIDSSSEERRRERQVHKRAHVDRARSAGNTGAREPRQSKPGHPGRQENHPRPEQHTAHRNTHHEEHHWRGETGHDRTSGRRPLVLPLTGQRGVPEEQRQQQEEIGKFVAGTAGIARRQQRQQHRRHQCRSQVARPAVDREDQCHQRRKADHRQQQAHDVNGCDGRDQRECRGRRRKRSRHRPAQLTREQLLCRDELRVGVHAGQSRIEQRID